MRKRTSEDEFTVSITCTEEDNDSTIYSTDFVANKLNSLSPLLFFSSQLLVITK
jgi:hypothetical protein